MCANYEPISKDRVHLLDLIEPTCEYSNDISQVRIAHLCFQMKRMLTVK